MARLSLPEGVGSGGCFQRALDRFGPREHRMRVDTHLSDLALRNQEALTSYGVARARRFWTSAVGAMCGSEVAGRDEEVTVVGPSLHVQNQPCHLRQPEQIR